MPLGPEGVGEAHSMVANAAHFRGKRSCQNADANGLESLWSFGVLRLARHGVRIRFGSGHFWSILASSVAWTTA